MTRGVRIHGGCAAIIRCGHFSPAKIWKHSIHTHLMRVFSVEKLLRPIWMFRENVCANMDVNQFGSVPPTSCDPLGISLLSFFVWADDTSPRDFFFFFTFHIRLSSSSGKLCPNPTAYHSVSPYHTKPGKAHPRGIGGSDEIKYTRRLIWITGARSMRTVERFLSLTERQWRIRFEREGGGETPRVKEWQREKGSAHGTEEDRATFS